MIERDAEGPEPLNLIGVERDSSFLVGQHESFVDAIDISAVKPGAPRIRDEMESLIAFRLRFDVHGIAARRREQVEQHA